MSLFKKLARGAVKLGKKIAPEVIKLTPAAGLITRAQQAAKALGINFRAAKAKPQPLSVQAAIARPVVGMTSSTPRRRRSAFARGDKIVSMPRNIRAMVDGASGNGPRKPATGKTGAKSEYYTRGKRKGQKRRVITKPPSPAQLAARARFAAAAASRRRAAQ